MKVLRIVAAVVVGYLAFALTSMALVWPVTAGEGPMIVVLGLIGLALIGLLAGFVAAAISGEDRRLAGYVLAGLVALATVANLVTGLGAEPVWYKVGTLVLTVPLIVIVCLRRRGGK